MVILVGGSFYLPTTWTDLGNASYHCQKHLSPSFLFPPNSLWHGQGGF